jgi:hypothetical protein
MVSPLGIRIDPHVRDRRCRFRCIVRVKVAGHRVQYLVLGSVGTLPLCARIRVSKSWVVDGIAEGVGGSVGVDGDIFKLLDFPQTQIALHTTRDLRATL